MDDSKDNCLFNINPDQLDTDKDGQGRSKLSWIVLLNLN